MTYLGDPSLTPDIQSRVLTTFDQTAKLASEGRRQEARLGCDFILRLDPLFTPAKRLQERLASGDGPIHDAADLLSDSSQPAPEVLKTVRLSTEELQRMMGESEAEADEQVDHGPLAESDAWQATSSTGEGDGALAEATSFLAGARRALDSGQIEAARRLLDMAGSLDPHSPELLDLRAELDAMTGEPVEHAGGDRIAQLLAEGQRAFDAERFQEAIDCWSRIYLIEIDHEEASRRIQLARDLREEQDRQVEETFHHGVAAAESGDRDQAIAAFHRVLALRPNHLAASEHLEQLVGSGGDRAAAAVAAAGSPAVRAEGQDPPPVPKDLQVAPDTTQRQADPSYRMAARAKRKPVNPFFLIGAVVLVLVAGGAWLLIENWSRFFPNAKEEEAAAPVGQIQKMTALHDAGDLEGAIAAAEQVGADSKDYLQARRLLARWSEELAARAADAAEPLTGDDATKHGSLVTEARRAYDDHNYLEAARLFTRASAMSPLPAAEAALFEDSKRQLEPIAQQIDLYTQRQWELVLPALWRRHEQSPNDKDVHQLLVNSYYNLAVRELRRADLQKAEEYVGEAARLEHSDGELDRLEQFVTTYKALPRDLLFEIYVQNLEFRR
jgi:tetratricopeptide (TPR) repeat protein